MHWKIIRKFALRITKSCYKLFNDYSPIVSDANQFKYKSIHGGDLKILSPNQMLQSLPIALSQVKEGKAPENLLN